MPIYVEKTLIFVCHMRAHVCFFHKTCIFLRRIESGGWERCCIIYLHRYVGLQHKFVECCIDFDVSRHSGDHGEAWVNPV